ncbi:bifunctional hydroxymethylpyrimidine kinase/phosphomethylpyrimidine kinase [Pseudoduganella violacea]|uniref:hydroxymethylpyrimidine kinase n=1 Tax=Pseudoduganella violacea TaxID=1715466 RepID=A0A7W5B9S9_9BURK|nr:hydroxymethylpyrimidine/phosphomethylpyrimidine kinase [Pseudoduganella violacea]MBB3119128.1 hydroxymethylpyrimidine/phosphomethylpyrimidine kinase [Pseudoduganella violacea]
MTSGETPARLGRLGRATHPRRPCVLVFAGADPSGGAGIAADIQAIAALGAHALPVITTLTVQDNDRVHAVLPVEPELVLLQARVLIEKSCIDAVKIGIPGSAANARAIAQIITELRAARRAACRGEAPTVAAESLDMAASAIPLCEQGGDSMDSAQPEAGPPLPADDGWPPGAGFAAPPVVLDPVLASGHGDLLSRDDAVSALAPLLPLVTVLTPNGPEAGALSGVAGPGAEIDPLAHARALRAQGCQHVLITGGHGGGGHVINRWYGPARQQSWSWPRLAGGYHGSGCTLASAVAALLSQGWPVAQALARAQGYTHRALAEAFAIAPGQLIPRR